MAGQENVMATKGKVQKRICPACKHTMSSLEREPHSLCINCRDFACDLERRCDFCNPLSIEQMSAYLKYMSKLKKDRDRKKKARPDGDSSDFSVLCTAGGDSSLSGVGDSGSVGPNDSVSMADSHGSVSG